MAKRPSPPPLTVAAERARLERVVRFAKSVGFVGRIEYRHVYSNSGGAQYGLARLPENDLLVVYAEAFDRDADPSDFSLEMMIAHERGHQVLFRHPRIARMVTGLIAERGDEILASIIGALLCPKERDRDALTRKAIFDLVGHGTAGDDAVRQVKTLSALLGEIL